MFDFLVSFAHAIEFSLIAFVEQQSKLSRFRRVVVTLYFYLVVVNALQFLPVILEITKCALVRLVEVGIRVCLIVDVKLSLCTFA